MSSPLQTLEPPSVFPESRPVHVKIRSAVREYGWLPTASRGMLYLMGRWESFFYDMVHGISTRHSISTSTLDFAGEAAAHAVYYEASPANCLRNLLRALPIDCAKFEFVDLGSGKGRSLFVAAEFPFQRIWGVELSPMLSETARRNCENFRTGAQACKNVETICGDAAEFPFPEAPLVIYLFNPFSGMILSRVLNHLEQSWRENPREIFVIYHHPLHGHVMESSSTFELFLSGTDRWDYRKVRYKIFRARA